MCDGVHILCVIVVVCDDMSLYVCFVCACECHICMCVFVCLCVGVFYLFSFLSASVDKG